MALKAKGVYCRWFSNVLHGLGGGLADPRLVQCSEAAQTDIQDGLSVSTGFVTREEEDAVMGEVTRSFRRLRYQYSHWDGAIEGYRETEKGQWQEANMAVMERLKEVTACALQGKRLTLLPLIHVLDLAPDGYIKPHVDSVKFCGDVIAGVSLLSSAVMRFERQGDPLSWACVLLPQCSLYRVSGAMRYNYTHAILRDSDSFFRGQKVTRGRRVSLICRTIPNPSSQ